MRATEEGQAFPGAKERKTRSAGSASSDFTPSQPSVDCGILLFKDGQGRKSLKLDGTETWDLTGLAGGITTAMDVAAKITRADGSTEDITLLCRIDTLDEIDYYLHGGILQYVLRRMLAEA